MTLQELAAFYNTDKAKFYHNYTYIYDSLFAKYKDEVKCVFEIGTSEAASLKMWRDYFPNAIIHGIDVVDLISGVLGERVLAHKCDQASKEELLDLMQKINTKFDIIIDDGSHVMSDILISLDVLFPYLKDGGFYIIEDVEHPRTFDQHLTRYNHWFAVADSPILDSNLIIIKK